MFIIKRKQITLILACLFVSFSVYLASNDSSKRDYGITQVSSLPVDSKVIVIDAGHRSERTGRCCEC